jgi:hypothetical protein
MKDVRYRVGAALVGAGVENSAYAKELMRGLPSYQNTQLQSSLN